MSSKKAVIDKISDGWATLLLEDSVQGTDQMFVMTSALPEEAKEGDWLKLGQNGSLSLDPETSMKVKNRIKKKLSTLRQQSGLEKLL